MTFHPPSGKTGLRQWGMVGAILLLALATGGSILGLQYFSDRARLAEISLNRIQALAFEMIYLAEEGISRGSLGRGSAAREAAIDIEMRAEIERFHHLTYDNPLHRDVETAFEEFDEEGIDTLFPLLAQGKVDAARSVARSRMAGTFKRLQTMIRRSSVECNRAARGANRIADAGTAATLLLAALSVAGLFTRSQRAERAVAAAAIAAAAQDAVRRNEERLRCLAANSSDVVAVVDPAGEISVLSSAVRRLWGYEPRTLRGTSIFPLVLPEEHGRLRALLEQTPSGETAVTELRMLHSDGTWRPCEATVNNLMDEPAVGGIVLTYRDIGERKRFEEQLAHQAFHDNLTGLPNRALFMQRLQHALARTMRSDNPVAVLFLDLDNFKIINDSLGHEAGDQLLVAVAERLGSCVRPGDTVARLGGDEFTVLLEDLDGDAEQSALGVAERLSRLLQAPLTLQGREVFPTGSIGITVNWGDCRDADCLLRDADTAMYRAKAAGKARFALFDGTMKTHAAERLELQGDLHRALERGEFRVYYQPIVTLGSGTLREVEALVRWEHPRYGLVSPASFIPLAEETGLIVPLGQWVLEEACRQAATWARDYPRWPPMTMSVNLSARQLQQPNLVEQVAAALEKSGLDAGVLKLEITESVMMQDIDATLGTLNALRDLGVHLAVDDFGTGYSSMTYLSNLPIDSVKIDRSFIGRMINREGDAAIVHAIVSLAKTLRLNITSEGIETQEQLAKLTHLGCDQGQGYLFAKPMPGEALSEILARGSGFVPESPEERFAALTDAETVCRAA